MVETVAFPPDGKCIMSGSRDGTVRFWSVSTFEGIGEPLKCHDDVVTCIAFSPDGLVWH